jgi:hypothetical protein
MFLHMRNAFAHRRWRTFGRFHLLVATVLSLGCGMPQGVSVVQSPNPVAIEGRTKFLVASIEADRSVDKAPSQATAFEEAFVQRLVHVARTYRVDVARQGDVADAGRLRLYPHLWIEEYEAMEAGTIRLHMRLRVEVRNERNDLLETVELRGFQESATALDCAPPIELLDSEHNPTTLPEGWWEDGRCAGLGTPHDGGTWPGQTLGIRFGAFVADYLRYRAHGSVRAPRI